MPKVALFLSIILFTSSFVGVSNGFLVGDMSDPIGFSTNPEINQFPEIVTVNSFENPTPQMKRYLIFGSVANNISPHYNSVYDVRSDTGFFSVGVFSENEITKLQNQGYYIIEDFLLDYHSIQKNGIEEISKIRQIVGSDLAERNYNYTGAGVTVAIVDTGVDFSNPDIQHSLARDENNHPIMLDADGQGIILTNATFIANIDKNGILRNSTKASIENVTSSVYVKRDGVFLNLNNQGNGTIIQIYNSFFPQAGFSPVFNGTLYDDMKIGENKRDYIISQSGLYHLGIMYQGSIQGPFQRIQAVPVLVVDSDTGGIYDTIIPDMSTSWEDFTRYDLKPGQSPNYDFDFTDETPIKLGDGNEFLVYDFDDDGTLDYSAGTVGAQVVDIYGVIANKSAIDKHLKAVNGTALPGLDPDGNFFGVMTDNIGHGTSSAASITSKGILEYDIYNNTKKYTIKGAAPNAKIIPVKSLWFGDSVYAWLWASGFTNEDSKWKFEGQPRADIISNSWGVSSFPSFQMAPGLDILSLILNVLSTPQSISYDYPGVTFVISAGNSGHGYGTLGFPNASPLGITVGATTNNVFVGYSSFKDQPRFGNTTEHYNHVVDFSSRGPGIIGDPKPDIMSTGAYSFTPTLVTKTTKDSKKEPFTLYGGTSMAAPLVSGSAAVLMESLNKNQKSFDPMRVKNILMSTATDLKNDPFTQGSGLVNVNDAIKFVHGEGGVFVVHNDASYDNIKNVLDIPINSLNSSAFGIDNFQLTDKDFSQSSWFGGRLLPGERSTTTFTIENPTNEILEINIKPQALQLIKKTQLNETTQVQVQDPILNKSGTYAPNYIRLVDVQEHEDLASYYDDKNPIPLDTSLMVLNVNFPFDVFMNSTDLTYANDMKISSLYLYDWVDNNNNTEISSDELSMINRGGSWGTVQEIRVTEPTEKFQNSPIVGVYPVPTRHSYWIGDTLQNSTSMEYNLSASYYKKDNWNLIWLDKEIIQVPPNSSAQVDATIVVPSNYQSGVYQGFLTFEGEQHTANIPISFAVKKKVDEKDSLVLITGTPSNDVMYGSGYVKGAFDMTNRYMAGDWRQYYFDINDPTINTASIELSWQNDDTNLAAFMIDPMGRVVQTNMPSGVFGHFMGWSSLDWLGTSPFSQGGGFFPVKNKDYTSSLMLAPINQTGTYSLLLHSTLFGGNSTTEPISIAAKFSTIVHDDKKPQIILTIPEFVNDKFILEPKVIDENLDTVEYHLDGLELNINTADIIDITSLPDGPHEFQIFANDVVGQNTTKFFTFNIDTVSPEIIINSPKNDTVVSNILPIHVEISDKNLLENDAFVIQLPNDITVTNQTFFQFDTSILDDGTYDVTVLAEDKAGNIATKLIQFNVDHTIEDDPIPTFNDETESSDNSAIIIGIAIGIAIGVSSILIISKKVRISTKQ